jgi:hypothetical protein
MREHGIVKNMTVIFKEYLLQCRKTGVCNAKSGGNQSKGLQENQMRVFCTEKELYPQYKEALTQRR